MGDAEADRSGGGLAGRVGHAGAPKRRRPDVRKMFLAALEYESTARTVQTMHSLTRSERTMPMAACSVLLSLALEVYLKLLALLGSHEGHLKGHNYVELFGDLDGDDQAALQTGWEAFTRATSGWAETLAEVRRQHPDLVLAEDFTAMLEENARAFEEWRYCHELAGLKSLLGRPSPSLRSRAS